MGHLCKFLLGLCSYTCRFGPKEVPKGHHWSYKECCHQEGKLCPSHLHHSATITGTCYSHMGSRTRGLTQAECKTETSSLDLKYKIRWNMDRLLKRSNVTSLQPPTVGCTRWVLVWPHHRPVQGDKLAKTSSLVVAGYLLCCLSQHNSFLGVRKVYLVSAGLHPLHVHMCRMHTVLPAQRSAALCRNRDLWWEMFKWLIRTWAGLYDPERSWNTATFMGNGLAFWLGHVAHGFETAGEGETLALLLKSNVK